MRKHKKENKRLEIIKYIRFLILNIILIFLLAIPVLALGKSLKQQNKKPAEVWTKDEAASEKSKIRLAEICKKPEYKFKREEVCLKQLERESLSSDIVYPYFDTFAKMLGDSNSYIRTRGIILIAANAKWDKDYKIDEIIDGYLKHVMDDKPITARQCIKVLPVIAKYKPDLIDCVTNALHNANTQIYKSSMQSLVYKDIQDVLKKIELL